MSTPRPGPYPSSAEEQYEQEIDQALVRLRAKMPFETQTNVIVFLLGQTGPAFAEAAFPWPTLIEIEQTLTANKVPRDINVTTQVPLTLYQFLTLHLMAMTRLIAAQRALARGEWTTEVERREVVKQRHNAYRVYQALESIKPMLPPNFAP